MKNARMLLKNHLKKVIKADDKQVEKFLEREKEQLKSEGYILN